MHGRVGGLQVVDSAPAAESSDAIDLRHVQDFFARRWRVILATAAVIVVMAYVVLLAVTPRYTATAQVLFDPQKSKLFGIESVIPDLGLDSASVDSQILGIRSTNLLRRVVEKTNLTQDIEFGQAAAPNLFRLITSGFSTEPAVSLKPSEVDAEMPPDVLRSIGRLRVALDVQRVQRSYVISIALTSEDPIKATRLANAVADAYVVDQLDARYEAAKRASLWLGERLDGLRGQVRQSEETVAKFRREHNLQTTNSDTKLTISEQQLSELNGKLVGARAETAERRAKYEQAQQVKKRGGDIQAIPDVVRSTVISQLRAQQAEASRKLADLVSQYNDTHPQVIDARAQLRNLDRSIAAEVDRIITNLKNDYDVAKAGEDSLQGSLDQISGSTGLDNDVGIKLRELERINVANKTLFESFLSRTKITQEQSTFQERDARIISPATKPSAPSFPKKPLLVSLALVVGLLVGIGGSVALDMLNAGFSTPRQVEEKLGVPILASVPILREGTRKLIGKSVDPATYAFEKPLSRYAETVRAVRMGVQMSDVDHPAKVVMVTSSIPKEGKSTLSMSLAFSALKAGQRVVLIDADLRHPTISKFFRLEKKAGLVDFLTGSAAIEQALVTNNGLTIIGAGSKSQNPPDLLGSARMAGLVDKLRGAYDYVVIDTPPVGPVIDARVAMQLVDKVIFVVRWNLTTREVVAQTLEALDADRKLAGIVLNLVDESKTPRYGPYSYYSGSYYKKYYQG
jgi:polysaccharide biosynthesis transport protein